MLEKDFNVLRCRSLQELDALLEIYIDRGWKPVGKTELFDGNFVQTINISFDLDITEDITQEITQQNGLE